MYQVVAADEAISLLTGVFSEVNRKAGSDSTENSLGRSVEATAAKLGTSFHYEDRGGFLPLELASFPCSSEP